MCTEICAVVEEVLVAVQELELAYSWSRIDEDKSAGGTLSRLKPLPVELIVDREIAGSFVFAQRARAHGCTPGENTSMLRLQKLLTRVHNSMDGEIVHTSVLRIRAGGLIEACARLIGFKDDALPVQLKLMLVEDVVEENNLLAQSDGDVHGHRDGRDNQVTLVDQVNELVERVVSEVFCF